MKTFVNLNDLASRINQEKKNVQKGKIDKLKTTNCFEATKKIILKKKIILYCFTLRYKGIINKLKKLNLIII